MGSFSKGKCLCAVRRLKIRPVSCHAGLARPPNRIPRVRRVYTVGSNADRPYPTLSSPPFQPLPPSLRSSPPHSPRSAALVLSATSPPYHKPRGHRRYSLPSHRCKCLPAYERVDVLYEASCNQIWWSYKQHRQAVETATDAAASRRCLAGPATIICFSRWIWCSSRTRRQGRTPSVSKSSLREGDVCFINPNLVALAVQPKDDIVLDGPFPPTSFAEGKTNYRARLRLTIQDKNKYNTPKYRFVVPFVCFCHLSSYSHELPRYGLTVGLTNYAVAYCTGLLLARRVLKYRELDQEYEGNVEATGKDFSVEPSDERRPFRALLDVGLIRTTSGNHVFGALKGALDGGLDIPHSAKRFAGFKKDEKQLDAEIHRKYIYGGHVADYMKLLADEEPKKFQSHFSEYIKKGIAADDMEALYKKVHASIRADPSMAKSTKEAPKTHKRYNLKKLTYHERKASLVQRLNASTPLLVLMSMKRMMNDECSL